jgi:hypothetical protein
MVNALDTPGSQVALRLMEHFYYKTNAVYAAMRKLVATQQAEAVEVLALPRTRFACLASSIGMAWACPPVLQCVPRATSLMFLCVALKVCCCWSSLAEMLALKLQHNLDKHLHVTCWFNEVSNQVNLPQMP